LLSWLVVLPSICRYLRLFLQTFLREVFKSVSGNIAATNVLSSCYHSVLYNMVTAVMNHLSLPQFFFSKSSTAHLKGTANEE